MPLLRLDKLSLAFGHRALLDQVDLELRRGERVCLVGRNGEGKSSLLRVIAGEINPDDGERWVRPTVRIAHLAQEVVLESDESVFLYFHRPGDGDSPNQVTLELLSSGYAVLWIAGEDRPLLLGRLTQVGSRLMGCIAYGDVPQRVYGLFDSGATIDVTSARRDMSLGIYEEFYVATLSTADVRYAEDAGAVLLR